MKRNIIFFIALIYLASCTDNSDMTSNQKNGTSNNLSIADEEYKPEDANVLQYVVVVADGYNYDSLRAIAKETSKLLGFKFDMLGRYFNTSRKKIVLPDNYEDDVWAGEYIFRREGGDFVSIEMQGAYIDTLTAKNKRESELFYADTLKMFVFANMYPEKKYADSLLKILKPKFKQATIIPTEIHMGCMH
jgi:hypothetical protein